MVSLRFRIHEWMADHFKGAQYPIQRVRAVRPAIGRNAKREPQVSLLTAVLLFAWSLSLMIASMLAAMILLGFFWAMFFM